MAYPKSESALLLIDWQRGFDDHARWGGTRNNPAAEDNAARLLRAWRDRGRPVFHVRHLSKDKNSPLSESNPGSAMKSALAPMPGEPLTTKHVNSAFIGTNLDQTLREAGIGALTICGLTTDHCVSTTVRMAANLGYDVVLAEDAAATFDRKSPDGDLIPAATVHAVHLASLHAEFCSVRTTSAILDRASH